MARPIHFTAAIFLRALADTDIFNATGCVLAAMDRRDEKVSFLIQDIRVDFQNLVPEVAKSLIAIRDIKIERRTNYVCKNDRGDSHSNSKDSRAFGHIAKGTAISFWMEEPGEMRSLWSVSLYLEPFPLLELFCSRGNIALTDAKNEDRSDEFTPLRQLNGRSQAARGDKWYMYLKWRRLTMSRRKCLKPSSTEENRQRESAIALMADKCAEVWRSGSPLSHHGQSLVRPSGWKFLRDRFERDFDRTLMASTSRRDVEALLNKMGLQWDDWFI